MSSDKSPKDKNPYYLMGIGLSLCTEVAVMGLVGWFVGSFLDARWDTRPWVTVGAVILFVLMSFVHIVKVLKDLEKK